MRRVLFVTHVTGVKGGSEKHLVDLLARMDTSELAPTILCYGLDTFSEVFRGATRPEVEVVSEPLPRGLFAYRRSFARHEPSTIVFVNGDMTMLPLSAYAAARLSGASRLVTILHKDPRVATEPPTGALKTLKRVKRGVIRTARRLQGVLSHQTICVSRTIRDTLVREYRYAPGRTVAIPNGVDLKHYQRRLSPSRDVRRELGLEHADPLVLSVARLVRSKGLDILLQAFASVHERRPTAACVIVGDGPLENELRQRSVALGISGSVIFAGRTDDVRPYFDAADVFALSSRWEGLPLVLLEAMAHSLPCVASDLGGNAELVVDRETGLIVKCGSSGDLAEALLYLAEHREHRQQMGIKARRRVEEHFDIDDAMTRIESIVAARA